MRPCKGTITNHPIIIIIMSPCKEASSPRRLQPHAISLQSGSSQAVGLADQVDPRADELAGHAQDQRPEVSVLDPFYFRAAAGGQRKSGFHCSTTAGEQRKSAFHCSAAAGEQTKSGFHCSTAAGELESFSAVLPRYRTWRPAFSFSAAAVEQDSPPLFPYFCPGPRKALFQNVKTPTWPGRTPAGSASSSPRGWRFGFALSLPLSFALHSLHYIVCTACSMSIPCLFHKISLTFLCQTAAACSPFHPAFPAALP